MCGQKPLVSIVTPSYNHGEFIEATIQSVLGQGYPRVEYLVVDGASGDRTLEVLEQYHGRLSWISEPDQGQAQAINKGLGRSRGEILAWLNSDDTYLPGTVSAAVEFLAAHPDAMLVYGQANFIDTYGTVIGPCSHVEPWDFERLLHYANFIVQPAAFFRRSAFEAVGGLDEKLHWAMDYDLWLKIGQRYPVAYLPHLLANSRWSGDNKTALGGQTRLAEIEQVARRHGARGLPAYFRLEATALELEEAWQAALQLQFARTGSHIVKAMTSLASSRPAIQSLVSPRTWQLIHARHSRVLDLAKGKVDKLAV